MHKFLATLTSLLVIFPAYSAGLGYNPFEKSSPTSATGSPRQTTTSSPSAPAATPTPKPAPAPAIPTQQDKQIQKSSNTQNKK